MAKSRSSENKSRTHGVDDDEGDITIHQDISPRQQGFLSFGKINTWDLVGLVLKFNAKDIFNKSVKTNKLKF